jgi:hypothetical protein
MQSIHQCGDQALKYPADIGVYDIPKTTVEEHDDVLQRYKQIYLTTAGD